MQRKRLILDNNFKNNNKTNKSLRRNIRRIAKRKGITYIQAILHFYNAKSLYEIDKNLLYSLHKSDVDLNRNI